MTVVQWPMEVRARWSSLMKAWYWMVWKAEMTKGLCPTSGKCSPNIYMLSMRWGEWQTWVYHHYFKTMAFIYRNICYNCIDSTCCFTKKNVRHCLYMPYRTSNLKTKWLFPTWHLGNTGSSWLLRILSASRIQPKLRSSSSLLSSLSVSI